MTRKVEAKRESKELVLNSVPEERSKQWRKRWKQKEIVLVLFPVNPTVLRKESERDAPVRPAKASVPLATRPYKGDGRGLIVVTGIRLCVVDTKQNQDANPVKCVHSCTTAPRRA